MLKGAGRDVSLMWIGLFLHTRTASRAASGRLAVKDVSPVKKGWSGVCSTDQVTK